MLCHALTHDEVIHSAILRFVLTDFDTANDDTLSRCLKTAMSSEGMELPALAI